MANETTKAQAAKETLKAEAEKVVAKAEKAVETKKATATKAFKKTAKTVKKATEKTEPSEQVFLQYADGEATIEDIKAKVKEQFIAEGHRASAIKSVRIYLKPEERAAYYVINDKNAGRVDLF